MLCSEFGGEVPCDLQQLQRLPGVGRKTANVVGAVMFNKNVMPVDTHVFRVSNRIGLSVDAKTPRQVEDQLTAGFPAHLLPKAHHWLLLHGRYVCTARAPKCNECGVAPWCHKRETDLKAAKTTEKTAAKACAEGTATSGESAPAPEPHISSAPSTASRRKRAGK